MSRYQMFRHKRGRRYCQAEDEFYVKQPTYRDVREKIKPLTDTYELPKDEGCDDCRNDCYDRTYNQILLYLFMKLFSSRVNNILDPDTARQEKKKIEDESEEYTFRRCRHGSYHLYRDGRRLLMCKEAFRMINEVHGAEHRMPVLMSVRLETEKKVDIESVRHFLEEFPYYCESCAEGLPRGRPLRSKVWSYINRSVRTDRFTYFLEEFKASRNFNVHDCPTDKCRIDVYDREFEDARYCFLYKDFPPPDEGETYESYQGRMEKLLELVKRVDVRECEQGTLHLWGNNKKRRISMMKEKIRISEYLHGEDHLGEEDMFDKLLQHRDIYPHNMWKTVQKYARNCPTCSNIARRRERDLNRKAVLSKKKELDRTTYKRKRKFFSHLPHDQISDDFTSYEEESDLEKEGQESEEEGFFRERREALKRFKEEEVHWMHQPPYKSMALAEEILTLDAFNPKAENPSHFYDRIDRFVNSFPIDEDIELYKRQIQTKFELSDDIIEFALKEMFWTNREEEEVLAHLRHNGVRMRTITELDRRTIIHRAFLFYTDDMKVNYQHYGDALCIDFCKPVIKRRALNGQYFTMGLLSGQNEKNESLIFGCILIDEESIIYLERILENFFEEMEGVLPETIITNEHGNVEKAFQKFKKKFSCESPLVFNWYSVLESLKSLTQEEIERKNIMDLFKKAMSEQNPERYKAAMKRLKSLIVNLKTLKRFHFNRAMYCMHGLQQTYSGFAISTKRVEQFYKDVEDTFVMQGKVSKVAVYMLKLHNKLMDQHLKEECQFERSFHIGHGRPDLEESEYFSSAMNSMMSLSNLQSFRLAMVQDNLSNKREWGSNCHPEDSPPSHSGKAKVLYNKDESSNSSLSSLFNQREETCLHPTSQRTEQPHSLEEEDKKEQEQLECYESYRYIFNLLNSSGKGWRKGAGKEASSSQPSSLPNRVRAELKSMMWSYHYNIMKEVIKNTELAFTKHEKIEWMTPHIEAMINNKSYMEASPGSILALNQGKASGGGTNKISPTSFNNINFTASQANSQNNHKPMALDESSYKIKYVCREKEAGEGPSLPELPEILEESGEDSQEEEKGGKKGKKGKKEKRGKDKFEERARKAVHGKLKRNKYRKDNTFIVWYNIIHHHWECSCKSIYITGIPCSHLIRALSQFGGSLRYYINSRWELAKKRSIYRPSLRKMMKGWEQVEAILLTNNDVDVKDYLGLHNDPITEEDSHPIEPTMNISSNNNDDYFMREESSSEEKWKEHIMKPFNPSRHSKMSSWQQEDSPHDEDRAKKKAKQREEPKKVKKGNAKKGKEKESKHQGEAWEQYSYSYHQQEQEQEGGQSESAYQYDQPDFKEETVKVKQKQKQKQRPQESESMREDQQSKYIGASHQNSPYAGYGTLHDPLPNNPNREPHKVRGGRVQGPPLDAYGRNEKYHKQ